MNNRIVGLKAVICRSTCTNMRSKRPWKRKTSFDGEVVALTTKIQDLEKVKDAEA